MNPLDALELAIKCAVSIGLVCCLPWGALVRRLLKPYPPQPEPFEPFAWNGPEPEQGIAREAFKILITRGRLSERTVFIYGDFATEWVNRASCLFPKAPLACPTATATSPVIWSVISVTAYYNEFDPYAAQWLRNLIEAGHIAPGVVDERSIEDVLPDDLRGFTQCHFFAGIGVWSLALRRAGWPDDRPVWTGSCPCQPFSAAGAGAGFSDERHLWPAFFHLITQCQPPVIFGEQVASKAVEPWVDLVHADVEAMGYAFGAVPFPSAGVGAPHIRDRLFWVADSDREPSRQRSQIDRGADPGSDAQARSRSWCSGLPDWMEYAGRNHDAGQIKTTSTRQPKANGPTDIPCGSGIPFDWMGNADDTGSQRGSAGAQSEGSAIAIPGGDLHAGPVNGFWRNADWLGCRDDKWRPVEPGTFPLANGAPSRVGRLRAYGNAINAQAAQEFIGAYLDDLL